MTAHLLHVAALPDWGNGYAARPRLDPSYWTMPEAAQGAGDQDGYLSSMPMPLDDLAQRLRTFDSRNMDDWPKTPPQPACWPEFIPNHLKAAK